MNQRIRASAAAAVACLLLSGGPLGAQIDPNDPYGRGAQRGIQELNTSGQVGTVTLLRRDDDAFVSIAMRGVPAGKVESAGIVRLQDCTADAAHAVPAYALADLRDGRSATLVKAPVAKLISGNYSVVLRSKEKPDHLFACGHLFH